MFSALVAFPSLFVLFGCAPKPEEATRPEVALIVRSLANELVQTMVEGAKAHQVKNAASYDLIVRGITDETDVGQQSNLIEQMVARGVTAIVIAPADAKALIPVLKRASGFGILVINIDSRLDKEAMTKAGLVVPFVGPDNREGARNVARALTGEIAKGDEVAIIEGVPTEFNDQQRRLGFEDALKVIGAKVVSVQSGRGGAADANTIAASMLSAHPNLKAILCGNDWMAIGAAEAVTAADRSEVKIVGWGHINAIKPLIADGRVLATVDQHSEQLAVYGIKTALGILAGKARPADRTTAVDVVMP